MTLNQLNYVIAIAEYGSMNKAAEHLYVAQPSLSGAVKSLEDELGFALFNRNGRGVSLTADGADFLPYAREIYSSYENMRERFCNGVGLKKKFGVSTQHYSFAAKAFIEMVKFYDTSDYEFAIRETMTKDIINDVAAMKSEIGILYMSDFNRKALSKLLTASGLDFHRLIDCDAYVYLWKGHPLANKKRITYEELSDYPCLSFEQGDDSSFYFAEEILTTNEYPRTIKASDRCTMLNLMVGLNGYTLCSGIICNELNGDNYAAIPYEPDEANPTSIMEIGYITRHNTVLSPIGQKYIDELKAYLNI